MCFKGYTSKRTLFYLKISAPSALKSLVTGINAARPTMERGISSKGHQADAMDFIYRHVSRHGPPQVISVRLAWHS